ncbi:MAG: biotin/lipoyl-containing protein [Oscillospiraceae bacterium]|jgi:biotin carboxyl carrier protein
MKRYTITVNGNAYDVAVEEAGGSAAPAVSAPAAAPAPVPSAAPAPAAAPVVSGGTEVAAPMPGTILDVKVKVGDSIESGAAVVVLEAMKMENDIAAPVSGKIVAINVKKGDSVESGALIAVIQ